MTYPTVTKTKPHKQQLMDFLHQKPSGVYVVTIHEHKIVKMASVDRPVLLQALAETENQQKPGEK